MAESEDPVVRARAHHPRLGAKRRREREQLFERGPGTIVSRREQPRTALEENPARACSRPDWLLLARRAECPPTNVNRGGSLRAASTISTLTVLPVSGDHRRLMHVLIELLEDRRVLPHRRGHRESRSSALREHDQVVGSDVNGVPAASPSREDPIFVVSRDHERARPDLSAPPAQSIRRSQSETDNANLREDRCLPGASGRNGAPTE